MLSCHKLWLLLLLAMVILPEQPAATTKFERQPATKSNSLQLDLITDDIIPDEIEKDDKKVIRIMPLELPGIKEEDPITGNMDSALYKIKSLKPYNGQRKYTDMKRSKSSNNIRRTSSSTDSPIIRGLSLLPTPDKTLKPKHRPKKKNLHFLYNQKDLDGNLLAKSMPVHVAPGAYPVYYVLAKSNGRFGKFPIKSFSSPQAFMKYLQKNKMENLPAL